MTSKKTTKIINLPNYLLVKAKLALQVQKLRKRGWLMQNIWIRWKIRRLVNKFLIITSNLKNPTGEKGTKNEATTSNFFWKTFLLANFKWKEMEAWLDMKKLRYQFTCSPFAKLFRAMAKLCWNRFTFRFLISMTIFATLSITKKFIHNKSK